MHSYRAVSGWLFERQRRFNSAPLLNKPTSVPHESQSRRELRANISR